MTTKHEEAPETIRPFLSHGCELRKASGDEWVGRARFELGIGVGMICALVVACREKARQAHKVSDAGSSSPEAIPKRGTRLSRRK